MDSLFRDVRYAVRTLVRAPMFSAMVVATLALGIGANTAIFSVVDAVLLKRLPYPEPERLVTVWQDVTRQGGPLRERLNYSVYEDLRDEPGLFEAVGLWGGWGPTLSGVSEPAVLSGAVVSREMFSSVPQTRPTLGPAFLPFVALTGVRLGIVGSLTVGRFLRSLLFEVEPNDPVTPAATAAVLGGVALLATWVPARRAAAVHPVEAIRSE